jgi:hypothetical protein
MIYKTLIFLLVGVAGTSFSDDTKITQEEVMSAKGQFEVNLEQQKDEDAPAGRMIINKTYSGDLIGTGVGQMISKRTAAGTAVYYAIEEFTGTVNGKSGSFTLVHNGFMSQESQSLDVSILEGSGEGELKNITGSMDIIQDGENHSYELNYKL